MPPPSPPFLRFIRPSASALILLATFASLPLRAVVWDTVNGNGDEIYDAGSGTWSVNAPNWYHADGNIGWTNGGTASFRGEPAASGTTYEIVVDTGEEAGGPITTSTNNSIVFSTSGYVLTGIAADTTISNVRRINVNVSADATLGNNLTVDSSGNSMTLDGVGRLIVASGATLTGNNAFNINLEARFLTGSTLSATGKNTDVFIGRGDNANGALIVEGGTLYYGKALFVGRAEGADGAASSSGVLTIDAGVVSSGGAPSGGESYRDDAEIRFGSPTALTTGTSTGEINLNGGTLVANNIRKAVLASANAEASARINATFNFNGGVLQASATGNAGYRATFLEGLDTANVRAGGAIIDTNGVDLTINQALTHSIHADDTALLTDGGLEKLGTGALTLGGANTYNGGTTVTAGTLATAASGTFGTGNITVASGAALALGNNASIGDTATLFFNPGTAGIALSFTGAEVLGGVTSIGGTSIDAGTYDASALNAFFATSLFSGTGSLTVVSTIPEPSTAALLLGCGVLALCGLRRRRQA